MFDAFTHFLVLAILWQAAFLLCMQASSKPNRFNRLTDTLASILFFPMSYLFSLPAGTWEFIRKQGPVGLVFLPIMPIMAIYWGFCGCALISVKLQYQRLIKGGNNE